MKDRKYLNMKTTKIVQLGILATIIAFAFPPVHYRKITNGKFVDYISDGHNMIFNIPPKYYIDWATLILELAIILCITLFFYYRSKNKVKNNNLLFPSRSGLSNNFMMPAMPTISSDWVVGGVHVNDTFYKPTIEKCIGKIIASIQLTERPYKKENQRPRRYDGQLGFLILIDNKVVVIHSWKTGVATPRGITIGVSTIHDIINEYGVNITRIRHKEQKHILVYSHNSADLGFFINDSGTVVAIEANVPLD